MEKGRWPWCWRKKEQGAPWEELQQWGPTMVSEGRAAEGHPWEKPELLQCHGRGARRDRARELLLATCREGAPSMGGGARAHGGASRAAARPRERGELAGGRLQGDVACARSRKEEGVAPWLAEGGRESCCAREKKTRTSAGEERR
jgi:hypothetical protein